jgi:hypothetical protein
VLTEFQTNRVWENMLSAEARSLYFADLASRYSIRKQWITGFSFFFSSGAAATVVAKLPSWVPVVLSVVVAVLAAYSIAAGLDRKIGTLSKLHSQWAQLASGYERIWNHTQDDDAESQLDALIRQEKEPSELAATDAPNDQELLGKWQDHVFAMYHLTGQHG